MAVVAAIKTGEQLRVGAVHDEAVAQKRLPGLQIVLIQGDGSKQLVPMPQRPPMIDAVSAAEPVPLDTEAE